MQKRVSSLFSFVAAVLVQKIAYCDTHAPPDSENKARFKAKKEASISPTDKMKTARRVLAKKRSVAPVISIPTIPPERYVCNEGLSSKLV